MRKLLVTLQDIQGRRAGRGEERAGWGIRWATILLLSPSSCSLSHCYARTGELRKLDIVQLSETQTVRVSDDWGEIVRT